MEPTRVQHDRLVPLAVDTLPINFAITDDEGTILWTNRAWQEFGERNDIEIRPDTVGVNYLEITECADDDYAEEAADGLRSVLEREVETFELEYPCDTPDGERWFLMRTSDFSVGESRYLSIAHIDVTPRVRQEHESERFKKAVEAAGLAIFITDRDGTITYVNPAFEAVTGYSAREAIGRTPRILKSDEHDKEYYEELWETILDGEDWQEMVLNRRQSGELYYAHQTISPVTNDDEIREFVAVQTEITDIELMKRQVQTLNNVLRHDLRTHLNVILGNVELIEDDFSISPEQTAPIYEAAEALLSTSKKGRQLSSFLERNVDPEPIDLAEIARKAVAAAEERYPEASIAIETEGATVCMAVDEIGTALDELLDNAVQHTDADEPHVEVGVREGSDRVELIVGDYGPGIPSMEYESIESDADSPTNHGTGFGLNLVYWIVRRSGGSLEIADRKPTGSIVRIRLPKPDSV